MRQQHSEPEHILSSSSLRTRQTIELMDLQAPVSYTERLYHATPEVILDVLRRADAPHILLLGHNPGLCDFARTIVKHPPAHSRFEDYPTGASMIVDFEIESWSSLQFGIGRVLDFVVPRDLLGDCNGHRAITP